MRTHPRTKKAIAAAVALIGLGTAVGTAPAGAKDSSQKVEFSLAPSSPDIAACFPNMKAKVRVNLTTDARGKDTFQIAAAGLPSNTAFTMFLLEQPGAPFGAAEYFGDFTTDGHGRGYGRFDLIVQEAFASTIVDGQRVRVDLDHVGFWFADSAADDACFPNGGGPVTPFDGDAEAGVQVMNSSPSLPGPTIP